MILEMTTFMSKIYKLIPINNLDRETQLQVLNIRNEMDIRKWMFTENLININDHFEWIENFKKDQSQIYLIIIDENRQPIGSVNLKNIDIKNRNAELGFYKAQNHYEKGLMTKSLSIVIDYSFNKLGLEKISSKAIEDNIKSINIHKKLLFKEEGFLRSHIIKENNRIGIYIYGLLKNEWKFEKENINLRNDITIEINNV